MTEQQIIETLATKVMGWRISFQGDMHDENYNPTGHIAEWNPLQNIADAWQVLTRIKEIYKNAGIVYNDSAAVWECHAGYDGHSYFAIDVEGKTEHEAICNAGMEAAKELCLPQR